MKMGTLSETIIERLCKDTSVCISKADDKHFVAAMAEINQMKTPWGLIHEPWFEKCNNVSALIGFIVGASVVGAAIGISKIRTRKRAEEWIEAIRCFVCLTGPALPNLNDTPDDINGMAVYLDGKIVGTVFQVSYSSDSERQSVYFSPIEDDWATTLQAEWNNDRLNVTYDFGDHPGVYLNHKEKES